MPALKYTLKMIAESTDGWAFWRRMRSRNACKTCALGMGGQAGGMRNESGHFPEVCKKSLQAQAADMAGAIDPALFKTRSIADLTAMTSRQLERLGRLTYPIVARPGASHFQRVCWDEALGATAGALAATAPQRSFFYVSGRSSNEAAYLLQLVARAYGTSNIHNCSYFCHQASGVALSKVFGGKTASIVLEDLEQADLAVVAGANPASNHPRLITQLMKLRRRGGQVIVINPLKELGLSRFRVPSDMRSLLFGSEIASLYLQPRIKGDVALFRALLAALIERGAIDREFVEQRTSGFAEVAADLQRDSIGALLQACAIEASQFERAVELLAGARRGVLMWAMGLTHHDNGVDAIIALANLALARGWLGRPGSGLLPIRGHSNVQGIGSMGVAPAVSSDFAAKLRELFEIEVDRAGQDTYASLAAAYQGQIDAAVLLGGNLYASSPDSVWTAQALAKIPLTLSLTTKLNTGHLRGRGRTSYVVPVLARDEESQPTSQESMFNFVRLSDGGVPAVEGELRSEVDVVCALASRLMPDRFDYQQMRSHQFLRQQIAQSVPGYDALSKLEDRASEFQIAGRTFHQPHFATDDGKAHFNVTPVPRDDRRPGQFYLMTIRSEGQFNSVIYEEEDLYRGNATRDVVMISAADAERLDLLEGAAVRVVSETGWLDVEVSIVEIADGCAAMYYPEANVLVPRQLDGRSRTPAFKSVCVRIEPR